jgi:transposase
LREEGLLNKARTQAAPPSSPPARRASASKLDPYREEVKERVRKGLSTTRILRELQALGYDGGRTILSQYVREQRAPLAPRRKVTRRFETGNGEEMQADWSTYRVLLGGAMTTIQVLAVILACSRRSFLWATDSQKLGRLLEGLTLAFEHFNGVTLKVLFDNMAVVTLGRVGQDRRPIWNPGFLSYSRHYGFEPAVCRIAHPDRKGEVEALLGYFERDCLRGLEPESLPALNQEIRRWNDEVANKRVHGTTGRVPDEAWEEERPFLIPLPERRYPGACLEELRRVAEDCTVSIQGTSYTVPARLAHRQVRVRLYSEHFEVLDRDGSVAFAREYVSPREKGRLILDPTHYQDLPGPHRREPGVTRRLEEQLLLRWPALQGFLCGLKLKVKSLVHVHLRRLLALAERYGEPALLAAAQKADQAGLHTANAVERILERDFQELDGADPVLPLAAEARVTTLLGEVESGTLDDYAALDHDRVEGQEDDGDAASAEACHGA